MGGNGRQIFIFKIVLENLPYALEKASHHLPFRFVCLSYNITCLLRCQVSEREFVSVSGLFTNAEK